MNAVAERTLLTPEELVTLPEEKGFELVDGELVERKVSVLSSWIGCKISRLIGNHVESPHLGWVFAADNGCQCFPDRPNTVRRPDVSFVRADRLTWDQVTDGWLRVVPDLVVEVISPHDLAEEVEEKVEMFHGVGVPLIWVVSPTARTVRIVRSDGSTTTLREGDELSGENVIAGFACPVATIFPPRAPTEPKPSA
ncbi:Uma2 family endonuclease [Tundrisphaera lichenicola]|uniref:Uma2 family endonuclease n=1 Tax=Tundrisphaera lichenicola TaxID=2029860 RepID=UPI003EB7AAC8